jgi:hypothetical protein
VCSPDRQPKSTCMTADSGDKPLHRNCSLLEEIALTRPSGSHAKAASRRSALLKTAMLKLYPKITALLWALLPQVDGSPALQSLVMCLYFIASGMATNQLKMLYGSHASLRGSQPDAGGGCRSGGLLSRIGCV